MIRAILIHGNGGGKPTDNWLPYLKNELEKIGVAVEAPQFPDSDLARSSYWIPFLKDTLKADEHTLLIGHSSGAIAAMKFAEKYPLLGSVLVGAYHTDLGMEKEKLSGYFDADWNWDAIKKNQKWIIQFADVKDPWIPIEEARFVHQKLATDYHESNGQGHFGGDHYKETFPEALEAIHTKIFDMLPCKEHKNAIKSIAVTFAQRVWDQKDLRAIDDLLDPGCIIHSLLGDFYGPSSMKTVVAAWLDAFPNLIVNPTSVLSERDLVVIQWQAHGTHSGIFKGIQPTGRTVSYSGVTIYKINQSKIIEYWAYIDMKSLLDQLI